jgi:hemerythrin-like metal-binding protein
MPFVVWNDRLRVGVPSFDDDHRRLVDLMNELYEAILAGRGRSMVDRVFDEMDASYRSHCVREEEALIRTGFPAAGEHKQEHDRIYKKIESLRAQFGEGALAAPSLEAMALLKDWLHEHLLNWDMKYVEHLKHRGIR